ncbi:MAG TPA: metal ABC transporter substrate-binding protein [Kiritimatiellia bacterium]|nr:metal ABC transporter substrate-binding protein [Kiritimatiellia bacterium]HPS09169.1 metal ABC transporter substrate-binding protein [Kiritimatiellia bacterium]
MNQFKVMLLVAACLSNAQAAKIKIVTTTTDLADIARAVAGNAAEVSSITTGREDPHTLTAKPGFIVRARDADVWIRIGMELEIGWEPVILRDARNTRIRVGMPRHIDASDHVIRLEVPTQRVTRDQGDIHPEGNPHYWLDPLNGRLVAATIAERLCALYPEHKAKFEEDLHRFERDLDTRMFGAALVDALGGENLWKAIAEKRLEAFLAEKGMADKAGGWYGTMRPHQGKTIVTYHRSWVYLTERFGLRGDLQLEPKPGIPPSAKHLASLVSDAEARKVRVILQEPFYTLKAAEFVAARTGAKVVVVPTMTGGSAEATSYLDMLDNVIRKVSAEL